MYILSKRISSNTWKKVGEYPNYDEAKKRMIEMLKNREASAMKIEDEKEVEE